jgi:hypothetical protein
LERVKCECNISFAFLLIFINQGVCFISDVRNACDRCPFMSESAAEMEAHKEQHLSRPGAIFKCYFCPFYVSLKRFVIFTASLLTFVVGRIVVDYEITGKVRK